jgi:hypothetical protein
MSRWPAAILSSHPSAGRRPGHLDQGRVSRSRDPGAHRHVRIAVPLASEFIGASVLAIKANVPIATLADTPMQFPTFGEALTYAVKDL